MKCLICHEKVEGSPNKEVHPKCSKYLYGNTTPPEVTFGSDEINNLAKKIILNHRSISGVQKKMSAHIQKITSKATRLTLVGLWGDYILKPASTEYPLLPLVENCTMKVTEQFGINVMKHGLIRLTTGELAYVTKRFDRVNALPVLHMEDGAQLTNSLTEFKYRSSTEKLGKCIKKIATNSLFDLIKYFEMIIVSFLTGNADMHLKNFSVYYKDTKFTGLCPAYDMVSTRLLISEKADNEDLALSLNGKKRKLKREDFMTAGINCGLSEKQIVNAINRITDKIPNAESAIKKSFLPEDMKSDFLKILSERSERLSLI